MSDAGTSYLDDRLRPGLVADRATDLAKACSQWATSSELASAVENRCAATGDSPEAVQNQLVRITSWQPKQLEAVVESELGPHRTRIVVPDRILHLAAGTVPGLAIDSLLLPLLLGSQHVVRPSRDDHETAHFHTLLKRVTPHLAEQLELTNNLDWPSYDAAVVWGNDATVALVRHKLGQATPIAAYGSRTSIAVVSAVGIAELSDPSMVANLLARDVDEFQARGCMSPRCLVLIESSHDIESAADEALEPAADERAALELASVERAANELAAVERTAVERDLRLIRCTIPELSTVDFGLTAPLQTVSLCCGEAERDDLLPLLARRGATRICELGQAHAPLLGGYHDGRSRLRDLVRFVELS